MVRELSSFWRDFSVQNQLSSRCALNSNLTGGVVFNCVETLLCFVVMSELVIFINFTFSIQCVVLDYVDVRDREDLLESRRQ